MKENQLKKALHGKTNTSGKSDRFNAELAKLRSQLDEGSDANGAGHGASEPSKQTPGLGVGATARIAVLRQKHEKVGDLDRNVGTSHCRRTSYEGCSTGAAAAAAAAAAAFRAQSSGGHAPPLTATATVRKAGKHSLDAQTKGGPSPRPFDGPATSSLGVQQPSEIRTRRFSFLDSEESTTGLKQETSSDFSDVSSPILNSSGHRLVPSHLITSAPSLTAGRGLPLEPLPHHHPEIASHTSAVGCDSHIRRQPNPSLIAAQTSATKRLSLDNAIQAGLLQPSQHPSETAVFIPSTRLRRLSEASAGTHSYTPHPPSASASFTTMHRFISAEGHHGGVGLSQGSASSVGTHAAAPLTYRSRRSGSMVIAAEGAALMQKLQELDRDYGLDDEGSSPAMLSLNEFELMRQNGRSAASLGSGHKGYSPAAPDSDTVPRPPEVFGGKSKAAVKALVSGLGENMRKASISRFQHEEADRRRSAEAAAKQPVASVLHQRHTSAAACSDIPVEERTPPVEAIKLSPAANETAKAPGPSIMNSLASKFAKIFARD